MRMNGMTVSGASKISECVFHFWREKNVQVWLSQTWPMMKQMNFERSSVLCPKYHLSCILRDNVAWWLKILASSFKSTTLVFYVYTKNRPILHAQHASKPIYGTFVRYQEKWPHQATTKSFSLGSFQDLWSSGKQCIQTHVFERFGSFCYVQEEISPHPYDKSVSERHLFVLWHAD